MIQCRHLILLITSLLPGYMVAQTPILSSERQEAMKIQARTRIGVLQEALNSIGDPNESKEYKEAFKRDLFRNVLESSDVLIFNDLPIGSEERYMRAEDYLNSVQTLAADSSDSLVFRFDIFELGELGYDVQQSQYNLRVSYDRAMINPKITTSVQSSLKLDAFFSFKVVSDAISEPRLYKLDIHTYNVGIAAPEPNAPMTRKCITHEDQEVMKEEVRQSLEVFEDRLNSLGDPRLTIRDKDAHKISLLSHTFQSDDVFLFNDLDPYKKETEIDPAEEYLDKIQSLFSDGPGVSFVFENIEVGDLHFDETEHRLDIKVSYDRNIDGLRINQNIRNTQRLDAYFCFNIEQDQISGPRIYSIKSHSDDVRSFPPAFIGSESNPLVLQALEDGELPSFFCDGYQALIPSPSTSIRLTSVPPGANIRIREDPSFEGRTDTSVEGLEPGTYHITFSRLGYVTEEREIEVKPGVASELIVGLAVRRTTSIKLTSEPTSADIRIREDPSFRGKTDMTIEDLQPGTYHFTLAKPGFLNAEREIEIKAGVSSELFVNMKPFQPVNDAEVERLQSKINRHRSNGWIWLTGAVLSGAAGGYLKYMADQKYQDYQVSTNPLEVRDLRETVELYDKLWPGLLGLAGVCTVGFTLQTVKKGKARKELRIMTNGQMVGMSHTF